MKPLTKRQAIASARARLAANPKDAAAQRFLEPRQAGEAAALSVYELCPRYSYILDRFVAIFGPQGVVA